jgi:two-component system alkaline phosphatase synthesis response regulator PhoP
MSPNQSVLIVSGQNSQFEELIPIMEKFNLDVFRLRYILDVREHLNSGTPNLILTDILIDNKDAIDLISDIHRIREDELASIVVFSERKEHYVEVTALNAGADDFLVKPVNKRVFESRLNAWLRHLEIRSNRQNKVRGRGDVILDEEKFSAYVKNTEVLLQRKEFEIMSLLISKPKKVFSREEIKESVWVDVQNVRNRTIDVHIRNLRSKIGSKYIKTYKGIGYSYDS